MAFYNSGENNFDEIANNKQHLNLSRTAYEVIQNDMFAFGESKLSGFINTIFENYHMEAEASISITLNTLHGHLYELFSDVNSDEKTKNKLIKKLLDARAKEIKSKNDAYENGNSFKFWLNAKNFRYLTEPMTECEEDKYYSSRGKYIKCVIEEYARLPFIERERIYYNDFVQIITEAIKTKKMLRIASDSNCKIYSVCPYNLLCDPLSTANYLIGYCRPYESPEAKLQPCSFRLSALKSIKIEKSKGFYLKAEEKNNLTRTISTRGVQFMVEKEAEIVVKLTDKGIEKYHRQTHLRPAFTKKLSDNIFSFTCTTSQAEFYFFKFGKDAKILSPQSLRDRFSKLYTDAKELYETKDVNYD